MFQENNKQPGQIFDVRHTDMNGGLLSRGSQSSNKTVDLRKKELQPLPSSEGFNLPENIYPFQNSDETNFSHQEKQMEPTEDIWEKYDFSVDFPVKIEDLSQKKEDVIAPFPENVFFDTYAPPESFFQRQSNLVANFFSKKVFKLSLSLIGIFFFIFCGFFTIRLIQKGPSLKAFLMQKGEFAYANLAQAQTSVLNKDFSGSSFQFQEAYNDFDKISREINSFGGFLTDASRYMPFLSKLSSGKYLAETGKNVSQIGILASQIVSQLDNLKNPLKAESDSISFLKIFQDIDKNSKEITSLLDEAEKNIKKIDIDDIPEKQRLKFIELKERLPQVKNIATTFSANGDIIEDILGGNGPRKYLFLFQNNQEMRATGGFIGTYGVLDIFDGHVKKFFIDGIFNPDGQLKEKVIPPSPIQKISAAWSLHDSNWFPDFPVSAEKATWFYEKTGGPTVDGVITMTPTVMQKLLAITGPISMPEYNVTINEDNFLENIQQEVEVDYDKEINQPKKILADLAPIVLDRIFNAQGFSDVSKIAKILQESLNEKQILIYSKNYEIEKKLSELGWSGEILKTQKDYLSVINSNINGYKTDGVIDEKIKLESTIQNDGSILNEVTITRKHNGGNLEYDWWNRVNSDYMRVYVPKGSILISAEGQTREFNSPPLDYRTLNFKRDPQVDQEESEIVIDEESGTRVYEDAGKTVFANWVYVSPQETVEVKYKYLLPFKINIDEKEKNIDTYSLVAQKQSGSFGSEFIATIKFPSYYNVIWEYPEKSSKQIGEINLTTNLVRDKFIGIAFSK